MPTFTALSDIYPRVGNRPIDTVTPPTQNDVTAILNEAEAELTGLLRALSIGIPVAGSEGGLQITKWVADYVAGVLRKSWAAAAGDGHNPDGRQEVADWTALLHDIERRPEIYGARLNAGSATSAVGLASNYTQNIPTQASPNAPPDTPYSAIVKLNRLAPDSVL